MEGDPKVEKVMYLLWGEGLSTDCYNRIYEAVAELSEYRATRLVESLLAEFNRLRGKAPK